MDFDNDFMKLAKTSPDSTDGLFPIFHYETRKNEQKSLEAGTNIYEKIPYVEIISPGNDKEKINRRVKQSDIDRWPAHWDRFQAGHEKPEFDGLPVTEWPMCDAHLARTLNDANIFTVEQLAAVPDIDIQILGPGMQTLKGKAQEWVKRKLSQNDELEAALAKIKELEAPGVPARVAIEVVVKNGGWYAWRGEKFRADELPAEIAAAVKGALGE